MSIVWIEGLILFVYIALSFARNGTSDSFHLVCIRFEDTMLFADCGDPSPIHGESNSSDSNYLSVKKIVCHEGYDLIGNDTSVCQYNSKWTSYPECQIKGKQLHTLAKNTQQYVTF